jgi:hypothetical protein
MKTLAQIATSPGRNADAGQILKDFAAEVSNKGDTVC